MQVPQAMQSSEITCAMMLENLEGCYVVCLLCHAPRRCVRIA